MTATTTRLIGRDPNQISRNRDLGDLAFQNKAGVQIDTLQVNTLLTYPGTYGGIYVYDGATAQSIATGATPITLTCFNTAAGANGLSNDMTVDKANNKITVTRAGTYQILWTLSFLTGTNGVQWEAYPFYGSTQMTGAGALIYAANNAQAVCITAHGYATIPANTDITLRAYHNNGGSVNITVGHANLNCTRVGN
jgi:hypothetical protein